MVSEKYVCNKRDIEQRRDEKVELEEREDGERGGELEECIEDMKRG
jgi:hypothetical protein